MTLIGDLNVFVTDVGDRESLRLLLIEAGGTGEIAARSFLQACRTIGEAAPDGRSLLLAIDAWNDPSLIEEIGALVVHVFSALVANYPSRQDAVAARSALVSRADSVTDRAGETFGPDLHSFLLRLSGEAAIQISAQAATRAPLVRVETGVSLPSSLLAFDLYGDPNRGEELLVRNRVGTPLVMPTVIEALSS